jgi:hypothetical protein
MGDANKNKVTKRKCIAGGKEPCEYCKVMERDGRITINNIPAVMSPCELRPFRWDETP